MNKGVLARVKRIIETNPERHYQGWWLTSAFSPGFGSSGPLFRQPREAEGLGRWGLIPLPDRDLVLGSGDSPAEAVCGTRGCVGGWICLLSAPEGALVSSDSIYIPTGSGMREPGATRVHSPAGGGRWYHQRFIRDFAMEEAGLLREQVDYLFDGARSRDEVLRCLTYLLEGGHEEAGLRELAEVCGGERDEDASWEEDWDDDYIGEER